MDGSGLGVVIWTPGFTVTVRLCDPLTAPAASDTVTEKLKGVADVSTGAVPVRTPAVDRVSHDGKPALCQVSGVVPPPAASVWLYAIPDVVSGNVEVVTEGVGLMVSENVLVEKLERLSVTCKVKLTVPVAVGVPLSTPPLVMVSHAGNVEPLSAKVSAPVPPEARMVCAYGRLMVQAGRGEAFVIVGSGLTTTEYGLVAEAPSESVAFAEKENVVCVATDGAVPLSKPPALSVSHAGRPVALKAMEPVPPVAVSVCG